MAFGEIAKYSFSYYAMFDEHRNNEKLPMEQGQHIGRYWTAVITSKIFSTNDSTKCQIRNTATSWNVFNHLKITMIIYHKALQLSIKRTYVDLKIVKKPEVDSLLNDMPFDVILQ
ncbi:conserved hypothetical protein [Trichinella spiralis]|uniref:hypothetical protein n=1 Tax=Trichinella spiralis TaxID=6334 RepID=UPI0001EFE970|nr:conserved hypothetical protein [Trichinella spiralis]